MELLSEIIALDDAARKRVEDARAFAQSLKDDDLTERERITKENEKKLEEQRSESLDEIEAAKQEAAKKFDLYEREKRAGLEERFRKNEDRLIEGIINNVYSI